MPSWLRKLANAIREYWRHKFSNAAAAAKTAKKKKQTRTQNRKQWKEYRKRIADEQTVADYMAKQAELAAMEPIFCPELTAEPKRYPSEGVDEAVVRNGNGKFTILVLDDGPSSTGDVGRMVVSH
jgi:hypothetical protein